MRAYEKLQAARKNSRPTSIAYVNELFPDMIKLHGDRRFADDPAVICGLAFLNESFPVTVIAVEKGSTDVRDRIAHNFGLPKPEGYRKALRLMKQAEKFHRPVICFVDTAGAFCGVDAEERGQGHAIAENLMEMMTLKTPVLTVMVGEGGSGGALALAVADVLLMLENAVYSVISPEGCASILWKDAKRVEDAADCLRLTAGDMIEFGVADQIITENFEDFPAMCGKMREILYARLSELMKLPVSELLEKRYQKFRQIGMDCPETVL